MTTKYRQQTITDADRIAAQRAVLKAAYDALGERPEYEKMRNIEVRDTAMRVVRALAAANAAHRTENDKLFEKSDSRQPACLEVTPSEAVAAAFWLWSEKVDINILEASPGIIFDGSRFLGFAKGIAAAAAMDQAIDLIRDNMSGWPESTTGAKYLLLHTDTGRLK